MSLKIGVVGDGGNLRRHMDKLLTEPRAYVRAGFLEGAKYGDGTPVALVAAAQEFGVHPDPAMQGQDNDADEKGQRGNMRGIPAKHFMRGTVQENKAAWGETLKQAVVEEGYSLVKALGRTGNQMKGDLQTTITTIEEPDVSEETKKRKDGRGKLLIETRTMLRAVGNEVVTGRVEE